VDGATFVRLVRDQNEQYRITLPKIFMKELGWEKGKPLRIKLDGQKIIIEAL
jgi:bifunctional DNA-binding transcriptional regulator/antitoxin component of YhaV-PrlF toxin-antitoxin module